MHASDEEGAVQGRVQDGVYLGRGTGRHIHQGIPPRGTGRAYTPGYTSWEGPREALLTVFEGSREALLTVLRVQEARMA